MSKKWIFPPDAAAAQQADALAATLGISPTIARLLSLRGLQTPEEMDRYLSPGLRHLMSITDLGLGFFRIIAHYGFMHLASRAYAANPGHGQTSRFGSGQGQQTVWRLHT